MCFLRPQIQWEIQDPKMEVLYHIRPYFVGIFPYIGLIYGRYLQSRILKWPLTNWVPSTPDISRPWGCHHRCASMPPICGVSWRAQFLNVPDESI